MKLAFFSDVRRRLPTTADDATAKSVLGGAAIGTPALACALDFAWPTQRVVAPLLDPVRPLVVEEWSSDADCRGGEFAGIAFRRTPDVLFGVLVLDEMEFGLSADVSPLQEATAEAYRRIFRLLEQQGVRHLWRVWNYLADINGETHGLERYRQFNIGRYDAFVAFDRADSGKVPAACAIGLRGGPLSIAFIAGTTPAHAVENPRQISAYHYPAEYGPRSPTFSRAVLIALPGQESLFISGTASIVGYRTVHLGDAAGQARETLANVSAVVAEANRASRIGGFATDALSYRVYLRHAQDLDAVQAVISEGIGDRVDIVYVQADVCRQDLLLEVEATASIALGNT